MAFTLSLDTSPLVNHFAEADSLIDTIADHPYQAIVARRDQTRRHWQRNLPRTFLP